MGRELIRLHGWELRLNAEFAASLARPFAWGSNDCCSFAARCVLAVTGLDLFEPFRGRYSDERSANELLRERGGLTTLMDELAPREGRLNAWRGDIVLLSSGPIAVAAGMFALAPAPAGLQRHPPETWLLCWRFG